MVIKVQQKGVTTVPHTIPKVCTTESCRMEEPRKNTNIKYISFGNTTKCMCMKRPALNRYMYTNIIWVLLHNVYTVFKINECSGKRMSIIELTY